MKLRTLALLTAALLPAIAQAAPAQASKQQCLGYLKDGFQIVIHVSACEPAAAQDERYKNAFNAAQQQFEQANCERLLGDADPYVQKGVGWMLKVLSQYELQAVHDFLHRHLARIKRSTLRYAIEKMPRDVQRSFTQAGA